jgi:hypothetical protein
MSSKSFQISYKSQEEKDKALEMLSNRPEGIVIVDRPNKRVVYVDNEGIDGGMKKLMEVGLDTSRASWLMSEAYCSGKRVIDIDSDSSDSEEEDEIKSLFTRCSRGGIGGWCRNHIRKVQYLKAEAEDIRARAEALAEVLMMPAPEKPKKPLTAKQEQALATRRANAEKKKADKEREKFEAEAEKGRAKKQKEALAKQVKIEKAKRANQVKMAMKALGC